MKQKPTSFRFKAFWVVGKDEDFLHLATKSRSRQMEHGISICRTTGRIWCSCEDAQYRLKGGDIFDPTVECCAHAKMLSMTIKEIADRAIYGVT